MNQRYIAGQKQAIEPGGDPVHPQAGNKDRKDPNATDGAQGNKERGIHRLAVASQCSLPSWMSFFPSVPPPFPERLFDLQ